MTFLSRLYLRLTAPWRTAYMLREATDAIFEARMALQDCASNQIATVETRSKLDTVIKLFGAMNMEFSFMGKGQAEIMATAQQILDAIDAVNTKIAAEKQEIVDAINAINASGGISNTDSDTILAKVGALGTSVSDIFTANAPAAPAPTDTVTQ